MPMHQSEFISMTGTYVTNLYEQKCQVSQNKLAVAQQNAPFCVFPQKFHDWGLNERGLWDWLIGKINTLY